MNELVTTLSESMPPELPVRSAWFQKLARSAAVNKHPDVTALAPRFAAAARALGQGRSAEIDPGVQRAEDLAAGLKLYVTIKCLQRLRRQLGERALSLAEGSHEARAARMLDASLRGTCSALERAYRGVQTGNPDEVAAARGALTQVSTLTAQVIAFADEA